MRWMHRPWALKPRKSLPGDIFGLIKLQTSRCVQRMLPGQKSTTILSSATGNTHVNHANLVRTPGEFQLVPKSRLLCLCGLGYFWRVCRSEARRCSQTLKVCLSAAATSRVSGQGAGPPAPLPPQEVRSSSGAHLTQRAKQCRDCGPCQCHAGCAAAAVYENVDMNNLVVLKEWMRKNWHRNGPNNLASAVCSSCNFWPKPWRGARTGGTAAEFCHAPQQGAGGARTGSRITQKPINIETVKENNFSCVNPRSVP